MGKQNVSWIQHGSRRIEADFTGFDSVKGEKGNRVDPAVATTVSVTNFSLWYANTSVAYQRRKFDKFILTHINCLIIVFISSELVGLTECSVGKISRFY